MCCIFALYFNFFYCYESMINFYKPKTKQLFTITLKRPKPFYSLSAKHLLWVGYLQKGEKIVFRANQPFFVSCCIGNQNVFPLLYDNREMTFKIKVVLLCNKYSKHVEYCIPTTMHLIKYVIEKRTKFHYFTWQITGFNLLENILHQHAGNYTHCCG